MIEDKGSGTSLVQDLKRDGVYCIPIKPEGDKVVRMSACSARIESGSVLLPPKAAWLDEFRAELSPSHTARMTIRRTPYRSSSTGFE